MKKVIFDISPLGSFQFSCETYIIYYREKYGQDIFFYTRKDGRYLKVEDDDELMNLKNRVIVHKDLGPEVDMISHDMDTRVLPLGEELEEDELLIDIVERLGERASWKNSNIKVVEVNENWSLKLNRQKEKRFNGESLIFYLHLFFRKVYKYFFYSIFCLFNNCKI